MTSLNCLFENIYMFMTVWMVGCSSASVVFIAYDRYLFLTKLLNYNLYMSSTKMYVVIASYWICLFGVALGCILNGIFFYWANIFLVSGQVTMLIVCYYLVFKAVVKSKKDLEDIQLTVHSKRHQKRHLKLAKKVSVLIICYLISLMPSLLWLVLIIISNATTQFLTPVIIINMHAVIAFFGLSNSCINPLIYLFKDSEFRKSFLLYFGISTRCCHRNQIAESTRRETIRKSEILNI